MCSGQLSLLPSGGQEMSSSYGQGVTTVVRIIGAMVCLLAAPWVQLSVSAGNGWPHNALWHHWLMPISCHFRNCKALLVTSLTRVSGAIASVQTFTFTSSNHLKWPYDRPHRLRLGGRLFQTCGPAAAKVLSLKLLRDRLTTSVRVSAEHCCLTLASASPSGRI